MAIRYNDALSKVMGDTAVNHRLDIWAWLFFNKYRGAKFDCVGCGGGSMRRMIAEHLQKHPSQKEDLLEGKDWFMVPEGELAWITDEKRQYEWLFYKLRRMTDGGAVSLLPNLQGRSQLVAMIDIWGFNTEEKIRELKSIKKDWIQHKRGDDRFKWFADKAEGEKRCRFASDWLRKNEPHLAWRIKPIENYTELLIFFDREDLAQAELKLLLMNIRRGWNRQVSRERQTDKKQYNFILPNKVVDLLDELAEAHALRRAQVLELLIKKEHEQNVYLAGWERRF